jgi:hypothetical protein
MEQKSKMVSFRLSAVEYDRIHQACETIGIRSVSEFARAALHRMIHTHDGQENPAIDLQVQGLREKLESLSAELDRIGRLVKRAN